MNFSRKVKETAFLIFEKLPFREIETRMATRDPAVTRIISRESTIDPDVIRVMIRRYEQRIEWQAEAITKQEIYILRLLQKVEKLETKLGLKDGKRKPIQTEIFTDTQITDAPDADHLAEGAGTPFHGGIDEPGEAIQSGDEATGIRSLLQETPEKQSGMDPQDADQERN
jgi:hypothetical protein